MQLLVMLKNNFNSPEMQLNYKFDLLTINLYIVYR